jgi:3-isopropylmalate dehydratase small subunit
LLIDLEKRDIHLGPDRMLGFAIVDTDAEMLLNGWDPIALTLLQNHTIESFRDSDRKNRPWIYL